MTRAAVCAETRSRDTRRPTWGSIARLGRDRYRLRWWEEVDGDYARRSEVVRGSRRAAERRLAEIRASLDETAPHGRARARKRLTVGEAYERWWLPDARGRLESGRLARSTLKCRLSKWRLYVGPRWAEVPCADVRPLDVQTWLDPITKKPASDSLALLRQILDYAVLYDVVRENVARRPYRMPDAHRDLRDGAYSLEELDRIAGAARGDCCEGAMLLMMFGSCRTGESLGVRLSEVRLAGSHGLTLVVADVRRQVDSSGSVSADGELKNRQSVRPVVVPPPWAGRLWEVAEEARERGETWLSDDGIGRPLSQNRLRAQWLAAVEGAGLPPKQPRAARRSWETYMRWDMGVDRSKVEQMMGHALRGVTGEHYDKPTATMFVDTVAAAFSCKPFERKS